MNDDGTLTGMRLNSAGKITGLELFFQKPEDEVVSLDVTGYSVSISLNYVQVCDANTCR